MLFTVLQCVNKDIIIIVVIAKIVLEILGLESLWVSNVMR